MVPDRSGSQVLAVVFAVVLASLLLPSALAQEAGPSEQEPNDNPQNATFVQPSTPVSGEITASTNASQADADWFAFPVQGRQNVTVTFESGPDAERLLVFLAGPNGSQNVSAANDTLADATIAPPESTVTLNTAANESRIYFLGITGLSGSYEFTVETSGGTSMGENGTNVTNAMNGTDVANASSTTQPTPETTTSIQTTQATTTKSTSPASTGSSGGDGTTASGEGTSASGPGFGPLAALVALLAAALIVARRR